MANNKNLVEVGKKTRWRKGESGNRNSQIKPYSIRNHLRAIGATELSADPTKWEEEIKKLFTIKKGKRGNKTTMARIAALRMFERAIKKAEAKQMIALMDNMEGKLTQEIIIPSTEPAPTEFISPEEAAAAYAAHVAK